MLFISEKMIIMVDGPAWLADVYLLPSVVMRESEYEAVGLDELSFLGCQNV